MREMLQILPLVEERQNMDLHNLQTQGEGQAVSDTPRTEAEVNRQKCWSDDLVTIDANFARQLERELNAANQRIKRLEEAEQWIPASTKPEGCERRVLLWIVWPQMRGWCDSPEPLIGWWKHGPQCFALGDIENADHLVRYWMEIPNPTEAKEAKP